MKLLLDTRALIQWSLGNPKLTDTARNAIVDASDTVFVSAVSAFEIGTKFALGKMPEAVILAEQFDEIVESGAFTPLVVTAADELKAGSFAQHHRDPFDRLLIAQALLGNMTIVSNEPLFDRYGVSRLW